MEDSVERESPGGGGGVEEVRDQRVTRGFLGERHGRDRERERSRRFVEEEDDRERERGFLIFFSPQALAAKRCFLASCFRFRLFIIGFFALPCVTCMK